MNPVSLSGDQLYWIMIGMMICLAVGWCATFLILRGKEEQMKRLFMDGNSIRMLTVIFVVSATTLLAIMGALSEAVCAIFAGIVGYVLGSMTRTRPEGDG